MPGAMRVENEDAESQLRELFGDVRLLLVEDHAINREVALELLHGVGLMVDVAEDGQDALELAKVEAYDLILMDARYHVWMVWRRRGPFAPCRSTHRRRFWR